MGASLMISISKPPRTCLNDPHGRKGASRMGFDALARNTLLRALRMRYGHSTRRASRLRASASETRLMRIIETGSFKLAFLAVFLFSIPCYADETRFEFTGHTKTRLIAQYFPNDSIFHDLTGSNSVDVEGDLRLNLEGDRGPWSFDASYQLFALYGDRVEYSRNLPPSLNVIQNRFPNDTRRLFDLTSVISDSGKFASLHRLDRLWLGYANEKTVVRFGRQAISWGNGLFFAPMDVINPFDPTAIDTEYKTGDDMLYAQYLRDNGDDFQAAIVFRRNPMTGDFESDEGAVSIKYHGVSGNTEYDVLAALNHDDATIGIGGNKSIGGAVLRGDIVVTDTSSDTTVQFVSNLSYSWTWGGKNVSGAIEYYFNGFGQKDGAYDPPSLAANPELLDRLARGEVFSIGRHYLAGSLMIEISPLWLVTPNVFLNVEDGSALVQLVTQNDLKENLAFLGSLNVPIGPKGTEYGGIETPVADRYFSTDLSIFAQFAWYF